MNYRISLNGAINEGTEYELMEQAINEAHALWEEYNDEEASGSNAAVVDSNNNVVWSINEKGEIK